MAGCSSATISKMFSADHIVIVHIMYFKFHCKCALQSFLQSGARSEGYNSEEGFQFWFEFV